MFEANDFIKCITLLNVVKVFRLARYKEGGHFAPHNDGFFVRSATERSLQTFMVYLNGDFLGGSTNFIDTSQKLYKVSYV